MPEITKLDNGLRIITQNMSETETVALSVWINTGSINETEQLNGISHLLEHMAFKGTKKRTAQQIAEEFDDIGGYFNAHTSRENTVYYSKVLKEHFNIASDITADILQNSTFDEEELGKEKNVVLQEIGLNNDTPDEIIFDHFMDSAYPDQSFGRNILGTADNVKNFSRENLISYMRNNYFASNIVISVAGNIEHRQVMDFWLENFQPNQNLEREDTTAKYKGGEYFEKRDIEQSHLVMGFEGVSYLSDDYYACQLLANILGGSMSSRLFQEVREKRGLAYSVGAHSSSYKDTGIFTLYAGTSADKIDELKKVFNEELQNISNQILDKELDRAKAQLKASIIMGAEGASNVADENARNITRFGRHISNSDHIEKISDTDTDQLEKLMQDILAKPAPTIALISS